LGTTLQSIGDAVISTDATGNIVFMNEVAQRSRASVIIEYSFSGT
jgi:PAS domain-containing protein